MKSLSSRRSLEADMLVSLRATPFDPYLELQRHESGLSERPGAFGATASFVGTMRDFNDGDCVSKMTLDYYPGMTEKSLLRIAEEAQRRWGLLDGLVLHRVGEIWPGEPIVLVAIWAEHRGAAFDACRYVMEELKARAPFWKKETLPEGERWVERNSSGY
jgi:molybdopterin synthase catalytic subunit